MSAEANDGPAAKEPEAEALDFEVIDDGRGIDHSRAGGQTVSPEDLAAMAPDMIVQAFRGMIKEKLKRWFVRNLVWATVLLIFWEHKWVRVVFAIWAFIAGVHLAFLLYGWYASGRQGARLAQVFGGLGGGLHGRMRDE